MKKQNVAVIFGSRSTEHDISIVTAISSIIKPLELSGKYTVTPIYIDKKGRWFSAAELKDIALYSSGRIDEFLSRQKPLLISMGANGLSIVTFTKLGKKTLTFDVVFPATHGTHGEDGELMGLLEMTNAAYVGCPLPASAIAMDKVLAKTVVSNAGIPTAKYVWFYARDFASDNTAILKSIQSLTYPLFVKPVHLGSSIGINKATNQKELLQSIEVAAHYDDKILVEEAVNNLIEVTVPIIGNENPRAALVEQPLPKSDDQLFDFASKYLHGGSGNKGKSAKSGASSYSKLPADLPEPLYKMAESTALAAYKAIGCAGIARVDLLIDSLAKKVYFNEVNPLPGSLYAHNWRAFGLSNVALVEELIELAVARAAEKQKLSNVFSSNYLKQY